MLSQIYAQCDCGECVTVRLSSPSGEFKNKSVWKAALNAAEKLFEDKGYDPDTIGSTPEYVKLIQRTYELLMDAVSAGSIDYEIPKEMADSLAKDVFVFSAVKSHAQLHELSRMLSDDNGDLRSFSSFLTEAKKTLNTYVNHHLKAEYNYAVAAAQAAGSWAEATADGDKYLLQYRSMKDSKVREWHKTLDGITLPPSDSFWDIYYPPNGWNCRCTVIRVLKAEYKASDSTEAHQRAKDAAPQSDIDTFGYNPGKQGVIFPPNHPYKDVKGADTAVKSAEESQNK